MKNDDRISKHRNGYLIKIDMDEVNRLKKEICTSMMEMDGIPIDFLSAILMITVGMAMEMNVGKPQLLRNISQYWEQLDEEKNGE
jgi:hypothetical protein